MTTHKGTQPMTPTPLATCTPGLPAAVVLPVPPLEPPEPVAEPPDPLVGPADPPDPLARAPPVPPVLPLAPGPVCAPAPQAREQAARAMSPSTTGAERSWATRECRPARQPPPCGATRSRARISDRSSDDGWSEGVSPVSLVQQTLVRKVSPPPDPRSTEAQRAGYSLKRRLDLIPSIENFLFAGVFCRVRVATRDNACFPAKYR